MATTPAEGRALVREHADAGYDFIKVYNRLPADTYMAIVDAATERGLTVQGHVPDAVGLPAVLEAGQRAIEHLSGYRDAVFAASPEAARGAGGYGERRAELAGRLAAGELIFEEVFPPDAMARVARATVAAGTWNIPTVAVRQWVAHDEYEERASAPGTEYVARERLESWDPANSRRSADLTSDQLRAVRALEHRFSYRMIAALHDAGAGLLVGTDTPNPFVLPGFSIHEELAHFVAAGLTPYETLERATRVPAEFMGVAGLVGTVAPGKRADLILLETNPLEDVGHVRRLAGVSLRGNWLARGEIEAILAGVRDEVAGSR